MTAPRSVRAVKERLHLRKWRQFMKRPWLPPSTLPAAIGKFETEYPAVVRLSAAVDLMAFGIDSCPADPTEQGARRRQASLELCRGARDAKFKVMRGSPAVEVPPADFNPERGLGGAENSLVIDWTSSDATGEPWLNVQIETPRFLAWLRQRCNVPQIAAASVRPPKLSQVAKAAKFSEWRKGRGADVPTFKEDKAHMKQFGVGRDVVRKLREDHPSRPPGRPKEK
jgi:hypothetical protein